MRTIQIANNTNQLFYPWIDSHITIYFSIKKFSKIWNFFYFKIN